MRELAPYQGHHLCMDVIILLGVANFSEDHLRAVAKIHAFPIFLSPPANPNGRGEGNICRQANARNRSFPAIPSRLATNVDSGVGSGRSDLSST